MMLMNVIIEMKMMLSMMFMTMMMGGGDAGNMAAPIDEIFLNVLFCFYFPFYLLSFLFSL